MLVSDILDIVQSKSFGADDDDEDIRKRNLRFLNEAHIELWSSASKLNDMFKIKGTVTLTFANSYKFTLPKRYLSSFNMRDANGREFYELTSDAVFDNPRYRNEQFYFVMNSFTEVGLTYAPSVLSPDITVYYSYIPDSELLVEQSDLSQIYPMKYQILLGHGAFYYLCFAEEGTRPIRQQDQSIVAWEKGMAELKGSYMNNQPFSTYGVAAGGYI